MPRMSSYACVPGLISPGVDRGVEQLGADGHKALLEVAEQRVEAAAVRLHRLGEPVLGDEEVDEAVDPLAEGRERGFAVGSRLGPASAHASTWWR